MQQEPQISNNGADQKDDPSFEEALERLREIANALDSGNISLEESVSLFEEAMALVKHCQEILDGAEGKIEELLELNEEVMERVSVEIESLQ